MEVLNQQHHFAVSLGARMQKAITTAVAALISQHAISDMVISGGQPQ
jgi:hypothetical protein